MKTKTLIAIGKKNGVRFSPREAHAITTALGRGSEKGSGKLDPWPFIRQHQAAKALQKENENQH